MSRSRSGALTIELGSRRVLRSSLAPVEVTAPPAAAGVGVLVSLRDSLPLVSDCAIAHQLPSM